MKEKKNKEPILTRQQWIGAAILFGVLLLVIACLMLFPHWFTATPSANSLQLSQEKKEELARKIAKEKPRYEKPTIRLRAFDPNTADSLTLRELGLPHWMARNVLRYRAKGGIFRKPTDFRRIYGMTDSLFTVLQPYILIDTTRIARSKQHHWAADSTWIDSIYLKQVVSSPKKDTILELNSADTVELQYIRGIGRYTAAQIVRYRSQLGGYYSVEQLREIDIPTIVDSLLPFFTVCPDSIRPLYVNKASVQRLNRHPYLTFTQAKALYTLRREYIRLDDWEIIQEANIFTKEEQTRLEPYLHFK